MRIARAVLPRLLLCLGVLVLAVGSAASMKTERASAAVTHLFTGEFNVGSGRAEDLAVDSAGNVYVLYQAEGVIRKFSSTGSPVDFAALGTNVLDGRSLPAETTPTHGFVFESRSGAAVAIDNSAGPAKGEIYVTNNASQTVNVFSAGGQYLGDLPFSGLGEPLGVAVSSSGIVVVGIWTQEEVLRFTPTSANPTEDTASGALHGLPFNPGYVAIDSDGAAYAVRWGGEEELFTKFEPNQFESTQTAMPSPYAPNPFATGRVLAFEVDPVTNDIYINSGSSITQYSGGTSEEPAHPISLPFGAGHLGSESRGIAIDAGADKTIYATDGESVSKFSLEPAILPNVTTNPASPSEVGHTSAILTGRVDPAGGPNVTECRLEWGKDERYKGTPVPCTPTASSGTPYTQQTEVMAELTGLERLTTYHYRFAATNANGTNYGVDQTVTPPNVLGVQTKSASELTLDTATLNGSFIGEGIPTHYYFQYGNVTPSGFTYSFKTAESTASAPSGTTGVSADIAKLAPGSTYHYRLVATNELGTTYGQDETFTTASAPIIGGVSASHVTATTADLTAHINPKGVGPTFETKCHFEYGLTVSYGTVVPCPEPPQPLTGTTFQSVQVELTGLQGRTYYFPSGGGKQLGYYGQRRSTLWFLSPFVSERKRPAANPG